MAKAAALAFGRGVKVLIAEHSLAQRAAAGVALARTRLREIRALYSGSGPRGNRGDRRSRMRLPITEVRPGQYVTTARIDVPACIRSKPSLMRSSGSTCVIRSSMLILPSMYQSTIFGTSVRPRAPPNAVPFHTRPVTSWNGRVLDLLPGAGDADDHRHAPAAMAALERLAHHVDVADALEAVVGAAAGELDQVRRRGRPATSFGLTKCVRPNLRASASRAGLRSTPTIMLAPTMPRALHDVEADAAQAEHDDVGAGLDLRRVDHRADAGGDAAADVADLVERRVVADLRDARSPAAP